MAALLAMILAAPMLAACISDVRRRIIPDWTVLALALVATGNAVFAGTLADAALADVAMGGAIALAIGLWAGWFGLWGWGDTKLFGAAGLLAGASGLPLLLLGTTIGGGLFAAVLLALRQPVQAGRLALPAGAPRWLRAEQTRLRRAPSVPYGVAIVAGLSFLLIVRA